MPPVYAPFVDIAIHQIPMRSLLSQKPFVVPVFVVLGSTIGHGTPVASPRIRPGKRR
jgi:hypothetical protein